MIMPDYEPTTLDRRVDSQPAADFEQRSTINEQRSQIKH